MVNKNAISSMNRSYLNTEYKSTNGDHLCKILRDSKSSQMGNMTKSSNYKKKEYLTKLSQVGLEYNRIPVSKLGILSCYLRRIKCRFLLQLLEMKS